MGLTAKNQREYSCLRKLFKTKKTMIERTRRKKAV